MKRGNSWEAPGRGHEATALIITRSQAIGRHIGEKETEGKQDNRNVKPENTELPNCWW